MTREEATVQARRIARENNIPMVVTKNRYEETPKDEEKYGYMPESASSIFIHDEVIELIKP